MTPSLSAGSHVGVITSVEALESLAAPWLDLALGDPKSSVFQMPGWLLPWLRVAAPGSAPYCVAVYASRELTGLLPLIADDRPDRAVLKFLGDPINDRNGLIARPGTQEAVLGAIAERLLADDVWRALHLREADDFGDQLARAARGRLQVHALEPTCSPTIELSRGWDGYCRRLPPHRLKRLLYLERRFLREHAARFRVVTSPGEIVAAVERFDRLRHRGLERRGRLRELHPQIRGKRFRAFLIEAARALAPLGAVGVAELHADRDLVAASLLLTKGGRMLVYMKATASHFAHSPGVVLDWMTLKAAVELKFGVFDYGRGDEPYKFQLGAEPAAIANAIVTRLPVATGAA